MLCMRNKALAIFFIILLSVCGCAHTRITSQLNQEVKDRKYTTLLIHGNFHDLEYQQLCETEIAVQITSRYPIICYRACDVFFPGQQYTSDQISAKMTNLGIDGVVIMQATGSGMISAYIPPTTHTTEQATIIGNTVYGSSTSQTYGGLNINKPFAGFEISVRSFCDGTLAWYATASSRGNAFANWANLIKSACDKAVENMDADGLLK